MRACLLRRAWHSSAVDQREGIASLSGKKHHRQAGQTRHEAWWRGNRLRSTPLILCVCVVSCSRVLSPRTRLIPVNDTQVAEKEHLARRRSPEALPHSRHPSCATVCTSADSCTHNGHPFDMRSNVLVNHDSERVFVEGLRPGVDALPVPGAELLLVLAPEDGAWGRFGKSARQAEGGVTNRSPGATCAHAQAAPCALRHITHE